MKVGLSRLLFFITEFMRIAQIAPLWLPVPPFTYGGIESMLHTLSEELIHRGHDVTLYAPGDSKTSGKLEAPISRGLWLQKDIKNPHAAVTKMLYMIKKRKSKYDLIHNHFKFFSYPLLLDEDMPPMITTIHNAIDDLHAEALKLFPNIKICTLSQDAKKNAEEYGIKVMDVIPNGIDPNIYEFSYEPGQYLLYLGRVNKGKGIATALSVAKESGEKLIVAGNIVGAEEWSYFMQEVQPRLNEENVKFVGQVNFPEKINLLKHAKALIFPIEVREAFGLIMVEALACGTPVIAYNHGSVPEIVTHGKNGFVCKNEEEMLKAIKKIDQIDRSICRKTVQENFTTEIMVNKYEAVYNKLLGKAKKN